MQIKKQLLEPDMEQWAGSKLGKEYFKAVYCHSAYEGFPGKLVKDPPAMWEIWVRSLGWEDPLEKGTATYSSILAWRIPWTEEPGGLQSTGSQRVGHD